MRARAAVLTDAEYELFHRLVEEKAGIDVSSARRFNLGDAVARGVARSGLRDASALYHHLSSEGRRTELEDFIASLTVGETHFFRNRPQFDALERHVLPDLIRRRTQERRLRIWSAGCSSGEEPYSLAMLLDRIIPRIDLWNISILATDIDRNGLKKARDGVYRPWSFREVPPDIKSRYFNPLGEDLELVSRIRGMVTFEYLNLVDDAYPSLVNNTNAMDLIVCRNVLIYFREPTARSVIARLHRSMVEGGWLLMGHAEPSHWLSDRFSVRSFPGALGYLRSESVTSASPTIATTARRGPAGKSRRGAERPALPRSRRRERSASSLPADPSPMDRYEQAVGTWDSGDVAGALVELEGLAAEHPSDPRPPYVIAKIYAGRLELGAADKWSRTALERDRLFAPAHYLRGVLAAEDGRLQDAADALRRCVYADPEWPLGHFVLAETLLRLGEKRRAIGALRSAQRLVRDLPPDQEVAEGDGLTAGRLLELTEMQKEIFELDAVAPGES